jgi:hypothetical protein
VVHEYRNYECHTRNQHQFLLFARLWADSKVHSSLGSWTPWQGDHATFVSRVQTHLGEPYLYF